MCLVIRKPAVLLSTFQSGAVSGVTAIRSLSISLLSQIPAWVIWAGKHLQKPYRSE